MTEDAGWMATMKAHPIITAVMVTCTVLGVILSLKLAPSEWGLFRRIVAGVCAGAFSGICICAPRMVGS